MSDESRRSLRCKDLHCGLSIQERRNPPLQMRAFLRMSYLMQKNKKIIKKTENYECSFDKDNNTLVNNICKILE